MLPLTVTPARARAKTAAALMLVCLALLGAGQVDTARAASVNFCGTLVASGGWCTGPLSYNYGTSWTYTSNTYNGAGTISDMIAWMANPGDGYDYWFRGYNITFVNGCWYPVSGSSLGNNYGLIYQWESNGASHTLSGRNDDSPNHTGCAPNIGL